MTFDHVPQKEEIDGLLQGAANDARPVFVYRDSEGDRVLIKDSQDVAEAVRDAHQSGAASVKLRVHRGGRSRCEPRQQPHASTKGSCGNPDTTTSKCATTKCAMPQWLYRGRPTSWAYSRPASWGRTYHWRPCHLKVGRGSNEWLHIMEGIDAIFEDLFGVPPSEEAATTASEPEQSPLHDNLDHAEGSANPKETAEQSNAGQADEACHTEEATPAPLNVAMEAKPEATFVVVEPVTKVETETGPHSTAEAEAGAEAEETEPAKALAEKIATSSAQQQVATSSVNDVSTKVQLLEEMGFRLPKDIATKMIKEMGGRMDLIVRALVANSK